MRDSNEQNHHSHIMIVYCWNNEIIFFFWKIIVLKLEFCSLLFFLRFLRNHIEFLNSIFSYLLPLSSESRLTVLHYPIYANFFSFASVETITRVLHFLISRVFVYTLMYFSVRSLKLFRSIVQFQGVLSYVVAVVKKSSLARQETCCEQVNYE